MKPTITLAVIVLLFGCAAMTGGNFEYLAGTQHYQECTYQAEAATPPTNNAFSDAMRKQELKNSCLKAKGYKSA